ncbi:iron-sulfur cluster assembly accessory protein [Thermogutta sp.]|jgi:iron-sulfur cluster assembly protein|uniref:HesB/IscA family protein n=1 Tax=Thermogutta sp. TaxID=1962930 RepID=UPI00321FA74C
MAVSLTPVAASEIKRIIEEQKLDSNTVLRMAIGGGGCSGLQYSLGFDTEYDPKLDFRYECNGISLVTRKKYALHLDGTIIDFVDSPMGRGFVINNPNYPRGGGCSGCGGH